MAMGDGHRHRQARRDGRPPGGSTDPLRRGPSPPAPPSTPAAAAGIDCNQACPGLRLGGQAAPGDEAGMAGRLWLADAARTALAATLGLIGVAAPGRLEAAQSPWSATGPACPARLDL